MDLKLIDIDIDSDFNGRTIENDFPMNILVELFIGYGDNSNSKASDIFYYTVCNPSGLVNYLLEELGMNQNGYAELSLVRPVVFKTISEEIIVDYSKKVIEKINRETHSTEEALKELCKLMNWEFYREAIKVELNNNVV